MSKKRFNQVLVFALIAGILCGQLPADMIKADTEQKISTQSDTVNTVVDNDDSEFSDIVSGAAIRTAPPTTTPHATQLPELDSDHSNYRNTYLSVEDGTLKFLGTVTDFSKMTAAEILPESERPYVRKIFLENIDGSTLPDEVFAKLPYLKEISVSTSLGKGIFKDCSELQTVTFCDGFDGIVSEEAFKGCYSISALTGDAKIKTVQAHGFKDAFRSKRIKKDTYAMDLDFSELASASDGAFEGAFKRIKNSSVSFPLLKKAYLNTFKDAFYCAENSTISFDAIENFGDADAYVAYPDAYNENGYNDIGGVFEGAFVGTDNVTISFSKLTKLYDGASDGKYSDDNTKLATNDFSIFKDCGAAIEEALTYPEHYIDSTLGGQIMTVFYTGSRSTTFSFPMLTDVSCGLSLSSKDNIEKAKSIFCRFLQMSEKSSLIMPSLTKATPYSFYKIFGCSQEGLISAENLTDVEEFAFYELYLKPEKVSNLPSSGWQLNRSDSIKSFWGIWFTSGHTASKNGLQFKNNSVSFPALKNIGTSSFENSCFAMEHMPALQKIGKRAFATANNNDSRKYKTYIDLSKVESLGTEAFANDYLNDDVFKTIMDNLTKMGDYVFKETEIENVDLSGNPLLLTSVGTFYKSKVSSFVPSQSATNVGNSCFFECKNLTSFSSWDNLVQIGYNAFQSTNIADFDISKSEKLQFLDNCFANTPIKEIVATHPDAVYSFCNNSFADTYRLQKVDFSKSLKSELTFEGAFQNSAIKEFVGISDDQSTLKLRSNTFNGCVDLETVQSFAADILGESVFQDCRKLKSIDFKQGLSNKGNISTLPNRTFYRCESLEKIDLSNITSLNEKAFYKCKKLTDVDLSSVVSVGNECFYGCKNASFKGLDQIRFIGAGALAKCKKTEHYHFPALHTFLLGVLDETLDSDGYVIFPSNVSCYQSHPSFTETKSDVLKKNAIIFDTTSDNVTSNMEQIANENKDGYYFTKDEYVTDLDVKSKESSVDCNTLEGIKDHLTVTATFLDGSKKELSPSDYEIYDIGYDGVAKKILGKIKYNFKSSSIPTSSNLRGYGNGIYKIYKIPFETDSVGILNEVTDITLSPETASIEVGERKEISATISPASIFSNSIFWASSDATVAQVAQNGTIIGKKTGTAIITCYYRRNMETCGSVTVTVSSNKSTIEAMTKYDDDSIGKNYPDAFYENDEDKANIKNVLLKGIVVNKFLFDSKTKPAAYTKTNNPYYFNLGLSLLNEDGYYRNVDSSKVHIMIQSLDKDKPADFSYERSEDMIKVQYDSVEKAPEKIRVFLWDEETQLGAVQDIELKSTPEYSATVTESISALSGKFIQLNRKFPEDVVKDIKVTSLDTGEFPEITYKDGMFFYEYTTDTDLCYDFNVSCTIDGKSFSKDVHFKAKYINLSDNTYTAADYPSAYEVLKKYFNPQSMLKYDGIDYPYEYTKSLKHVPDEIKSEYENRGFSGYVLEVEDNKPYTYHDFLENLASIPDAYRTGHMDTLYHKDGSIKKYELSLVKDENGKAYGDLNESVCENNVITFKTADDYIYSNENYKLTFFKVDDEVFGARLKNDEQNIDFEDGFSTKDIDVDCDLYYVKDDTLTIRKIVSNYDGWGAVDNDYPEQCQKMKHWIWSDKIQNIAVEDGTTQLFDGFFSSLNLAGHDKHINANAITIPASVVKLGKRAFASLNVDTINILSDKIKTIPGYCFLQSNIKNMDLSILDGKITTLEEGAFAYINPNIKDDNAIILPKLNNVENIDENIFYGSYLGNSIIDFSNNEKLVVFEKFSAANAFAHYSVKEILFTNCSHLQCIGTFMNIATEKIDLSGTDIVAIGKGPYYDSSKENGICTGGDFEYSYIGTLILPEKIRFLLFESFSGSYIEHVFNEENVEFLDDYALHDYHAPRNDGSLIVSPVSPSGSRFDGIQYKAEPEWDFSGLAVVPLQFFTNMAGNNGLPHFILPKKWKDMPSSGSSYGTEIFAYSNSDSLNDDFSIIDFGDAKNVTFANYNSSVSSWFGQLTKDSVENGTWMKDVRRICGLGNPKCELSRYDKPNHAISFIGADTKEYEEFCSYITNSQYDRYSPYLSPFLYLDSEFIDKIDVSFDDKIGLTEANKYSSKDLSNITTDDLSNCIQVTAFYHDGHKAVLDQNQYEIETMEYDRDLLDLNIKVKVYNLPKKYMIKALGSLIDSLKQGNYINNDYYSNCICESTYTLNNVELSDYIYAVNGLKLDKYEVSVFGASDESNNFKLNATLSPKRVDVDKVFWSSSNENVATVDDNGNVTIHDDGEAELTAMSLDGGYFDTCELTVEEKITGMNIVGDDSIRVGNQSSYTANISSTGNLDKSVTWSLSGNTSKDTKVSADGVVTVGTDEAAPVITLKAVSNFDNSWSAQKPIIVTQFVDSVTVQGDKHVACGTEKTHTATVTGSDYVNKNVTWKISGNTSENTTIDENGKLVMAINENAEKITVTATSVFDTTKSGSLDVVPERISNITVTGEDTVYPGKSYSYQATVTTTNDDVVTQKDVVWSITGNEDASTQISQDGVLTIGAEEGTEGLFLVAQSVANPEIKGTKNVDVEQFITGITIQGDDSISPAESKEYTADVDGSAKVDKSVTWTVEQNRSEDTTVTNGTLICGSDETSDVITLKATSDFDPDITASKEIIVTTTTPDPTPVPTIAPTTAPTIVPTVAPTKAPMPTNTPVETNTPIETPTAAPTIIPTMVPTPKPMNDDGKDVTQTPAPTKTPEPSLETLFGTDKDPDKIPGTVELKIPTVVMKKNMGVRKKFQIKLLNAKGATVQVSSSNKKVATINKKGLVTTKKPGKAKVIINMTKGAFRMQYIVNIKVKKKVPFNYSLTKYNTKHKNVSVCLYKLLRKGKSYKITMKHLKKKDKVTFRSSNPKVIRVNKKGKCTSLKSGKAIITIQVKKGKRTFTYFMVVRATENGVESNTSYLKVIK